MKMVYIITLCFIVFDFVSGFIKAIKNKEVSSKILREGIFHKGGFIMLVCLATLIEYGQGYVFDTTIPVVMPCCVYICITEITSILENISKINPAILPEKLQEIFANFIAKEEK